MRYTFSEFSSGVISYNGAKIQLLDLPGIIEGAKDGKGRGRQVQPKAIQTVRVVTDHFFNQGHRCGSHL